MENIISWFEIPVIDFDRAVNFYSNILGVTLDSQELSGYKMAFFRVDEGGISGALVKGEGYVPSVDGAVIYLNGGEDLDMVLSGVERAGGKVIMPKKLISEEIGYYAFFTDTEGNKLGLFSRK